VAGAAVICQQQKKKPVVHLRAGACKKSEQAVFDTQSEITQNQSLAETTSVIAETASVAGTKCVGDPARHLVPGTTDVAGGLLLLGYLSSSLCRTLDDDPTGCEAAFEPSIYGGTSACVYLAGKCQLCDVQLDATGVCRNVCQHPLSCALDPARTTRLSNCSEAANQPACEQAWTLGADFMRPPEVMRATSCFWDAGACSRCAPDAISQGKCTNTCIATADLPRCRASGRSFGKCSTLDGNAAACGQTYELGHYGTQTCWYDAGSGHCYGCDPVAESKVQCSNGC
jgi:hypothetical protein